MIVKKTTTIEFYRIEFSQIDKNSQDLFTINLEEYSDGKVDILEDYKTIFKYIKNELEKNDNREVLIRKKKHKAWIETINDKYIFSFSSRENQNGAIINKSNFSITLAKDEKLDFELANLSHFVISPQYKILALEKFDGSTSKSSLTEYFSYFLKDTNIRIFLYPIPRDDLGQLLDDVKKIVSFKAKYKDIKQIMPNFLETYIFSNTKNLKNTQENKSFQAKIDINFGDGEEISSKDRIIRKIKNFLLEEKDEEIEDKNLIDGKIEIETNSSKNEIIKLQENLFISKLDISIDDSITKIEEYSQYMYEQIIREIEIFLEKKKK
ncbi:hypothetical protein ACN09X_05035 [Aliarcobacter butzleri]|uniref:hypothetical protein n=1 Tax=Aliarcobacter butzleri TaxID=28197 RepID=UPI0021B3009A|nr:hypothetical protein [Aliarcobacter butzleri]MCT7609812.1 hypothetical protein [Aliarcobacter butzleri]